MKRWLDAMLPIELIRFVNRTTATLLHQSARQDEVVAVPDAEALHQAGPKGIVVKRYNTGHRLNTESCLDQLICFNEH